MNMFIVKKDIQELFKDKGNSPIRTALVTSRNAPAHERAIKTLRKWNVHIDEVFFLGGVSKRDVLSAFGAHMRYGQKEKCKRPFLQRNIRLCSFIVHKGLHPFMLIYTL